MLHARPSANLDPATATRELQRAWGFLNAQTMLAAHRCVREAASVRGTGKLAGGCLGIYVLLPEVH